MKGVDPFSLAQEGERLCRQSNYKAGIEYLELALKRGLNRDSESLEAVSAVYSQLGNAYYALKDFDMALHYHDLDLETAKLLHDESGVGKAHGNIGNAYKAVGDFKNAYEHSVRHLNIAQKLGDKECESRALYNLGSILHCRAKARLPPCFRFEENSLTVDCDPAVVADLRKAIDYYLQNLYIVENAKDWAACGRTYGNLGNCYYMLADYKTAIEYHKKRLDLARRFGDKSAMKRAYTNLGNAFIFLKQTAKAVEFYRLALEMAMELKDEVSEAQCCFNAGNGSAISGEHATAVDYHLRHLQISRKLQDKSGEIRACAALAADYRNLDAPKKAAYFYALGMELASKGHDHSSELALRSSFETLYRTNDSNTDKRICSLIEIDPSADPLPRSVSQLNASIKSLLCRGDCSDCGLSRRGIGDFSTVGTGTDDIPSQDRDGIDEEFMDLLTRAQAKRINDQRCDPDMLADLTNRTNGSVRQSDSLMCTGEVKQEQSGDGRCSVDNGLAFENEAEFVGSHPNQLKSSSSSPVFRVPVAPPRRNRTVRCSTVSLDTGVNACSRPNQEGMLDLIANLQGRRMEEQRAVLNGQETESASQSKELEVLEDAGQLYDLVIRSQGDRLDEQRSELSVTKPDEDVSEIVLNMQKGRIEGQRASLEPKT
ncbi:unnamed protein product [Enterobius vermicularis]|uniref:TPR_REGION domain-containing protein n=1 Tax=Enterobius vermicularis TaxID=51028 RepID=A0A0N4VC96_ENTVE|nr:unnamed protein product [Enterobius vermicularis]